AARDSLPKVIDIMAGELHWDDKRKKAEHRKALEYLTTMGLPDSILDEPANVASDKKGYLNIKTTGDLNFLDAASYYRRGVFSAEEIGAFLSAFAEFDVHGDGHIEVKDIKPLFDSIKVPLPQGDIDEYLRAANVDYSSPANTIEFEQIFDVLGQIKEAINSKGRAPTGELKLNQIPTHRSGGGV
ncbi:mitochondrial glycerol-3-phosphate dehydrogenase, partial [Linderina pennispora]